MISRKVLADGWVMYQNDGRGVGEWVTAFFRIGDTHPRDSYIMTFRFRAGFYLAEFSEERNDYDTAAGPFEDLESAKVAYMLMYAGQHSSLHVEG